VALDLALGQGPQLISGPNAAGKTTLLEAIVLLALGRSHRTSADIELVRWGSELSRVEGVVAEAAKVEPAEAAEAEVAAPLAAAPIPAAATAAGTGLSLVLQAGGGRKRVLVNGVPRRPAALAEHLRTVLFAPEQMLLIAGPPGLRRAALDDLVGPHDHAYASNLATYGRALQQRNSLLRAIREGQAGPDQLRYWDEPLLTAGAAIVAARLRLLAQFAAPLAAAQREIAPADARLELAYATNAPLQVGESIRDALARRLAETADKEMWNGATLVGPHRDDLVFNLEGRDMSTFASRGQQRTAILAFKLAELDLLTALDGRPPLLLLDDVFSELDPERRGHLVRRITGLPQAFVTTTTPDDLDPDLRRRARAWRVIPDGGAGARVEEARP
jgi:DNA replication and repair protein RecF